MMAAAPCDKTLDMRWMPKDCDGQIKMGFNIISNAFKSKVKFLEEDLLAANKERAELEEKIAAQQSKLIKLEREHVESTILQSRLVDVEERLIEKTAELENSISEHRKREQDLLNDNRRLAEHVRIYKKKAQQLEEFRRVVVESIKKDEEPAYFDAASENKLGVSAVPPTVTTYSTVNRVTVGGSDFLNPQPGVTEVGLAATPLTQAGGDNEGRHLLRRARARLSVDQFQKFLETVRRLNAHTISSEEAILEAEKVCGHEHGCIFDEFKLLLTRKGQLSHPQGGGLVSTPMSPQVM